MSEIEETAKATQEVAKTANNALNKAEKLGGFITKYFGTTLEQSIGIFNDKLKYWRWENQVNLISRANKKMENLGIDTPPKQIPLKLGLPLLEAASLEDNNELQDLWANLLVNSSIGFSLERSYISVLEELSTLEAEIMMIIYGEIGSIEKHDGASILYETEEIFKKFISKGISEYDIKLALSNLTRLQCLLRVITFGGGENFKSVHTTIFGRSLFEAIKEPKQ